MKSKQLLPSGFALQYCGQRYLHSAFIFVTESGCCKSSEPRLEYDEIDGGPSLNPTEEQGLLATASIDTTASELAAVIPPSVCGIVLSRI